MWIIWQEGGGGEGPAAAAQVTKNNMKKLKSLVIRKMQVKTQCDPISNAVQMPIKNTKPKILNAEESVRQRNPYMLIVENSVNMATIKIRI